jgi:hypothetical protein
MAKKTKRKSPGEGGGYPYNSLGSCLKLAAVIKDHGGGELPKNVIAEAIGMGDNSPSFYQLCASTKGFGIIEGTRALKLTDLGHDYFFPTTESSARHALLWFIKTPAVFGKLIDRFDGKRLPGANLLANLVNREFGVPPSWAARTASLFISSLGDYELIDDGGFIRYGAAVHKAGRATAGVTTENGSDTALLDQQAAATQSSLAGSMPSRSADSVSPVKAGTNVWQFTEAGGTVRLETPDPLPKELWSRLKRYVNVLNPDPKDDEGAKS